MRWVRFAILVLAIAILQAGNFVDMLAINNVRPDLLLIAMVFFAIYSNTTNVIITSFVIGFVADIIVVGSPMGPGMISFGVIGTILAQLHRFIAVRTMPYQAITIFFAALLAGSTTLLLSFVKSQPNIGTVYPVILATSFYSCILGPFLFLPFTWWMQIKTQQFSRH